MYKLVNLHIAGWNFLSNLFVITQKVPTRRWGGGIGGSLLVSESLTISDPWPFDTDPDQLIRNTGLRIWMRLQIQLCSSFLSDFQGDTKKTFFSGNFFCLVLTEGTFSTFFKDNKLVTSHRTVEIIVFIIYFFAWLWKDQNPNYKLRIWIRDARKLTDPWRSRPRKWFHL